MRTRPALLVVLVTALGAVLLGVGWLALQPSATGIGRVPAPISVPAPTAVPSPTAPVTSSPTGSAGPTDVVPPPPLDDDDDDDDDDPDDGVDDGED
ncbi:MAG: hypothetical protein F2825_06900 [Actinobacteria bacterium]|uniref:Unannotated protein n=1 Tax=freshwater metagenome TaxID=449393 RepID=A0A6J7HHP5_9ZZZZ|nr:hypothetical protein [Actinomycetota bacterium]